MLASTILTPSKLVPPITVVVAAETHPRNRVALFPKSNSKLAFVARASGNARDGTVDATSAPEIDAVTSSSSGLGDGYVALFVRMLGLDRDPLDREQAIVALWKYSLGGKKCIDTLMQFPGCINLVVNLLRSESSSACEAAAGLLRSLSSVNLYRNSVADSGAIEEINRLLRQSSLAPEVKEQSLSALWNLSVDEKLCIKISKTEILPLAIKYLGDEDIKVKEAAGGILANLALSRVNHDIMVEAGVIPKLAKFLTSNLEGSKVIRKEARNALLELVKDKYHRILVIEEGLVPVPLIDAAAFKSFTPGLHLWPTLPDGTEIERTSRLPSRYGASELLLGLNVDDKNANLEEAKVNAIVGRTQQQFLARVGALEMEEKTMPHSECSNDLRFTLLPWMDGVARLVLILELEDKSAIIKAAESIATACINEHMRIAFREAGAIKHLVRLLNCDDNAVQLAATQALERLSVSNIVCRVIEAEGVLGPFVSILKCSEIAGTIVEKSLNILARILDPSKEMQLKSYDGPANESEKAFGGAKGDCVSTGFSSTEQTVSQTYTRNDILDSVFIAHLVEILKSFPPSLQEKAATVLEFVALTDPTLAPIISLDIESGLNSAFQQKILKISADMESDVEDQFSEAYAIEFEEAGFAISAASRLLTRLLDCEQFCHKINSLQFIDLLRGILRSSIPLHNKEWVAACLVKLSSLSGSIASLYPINVEITLYETIPRLLEQIRTSFSPEAQETAVVELNRIISEGVVDSTEAIISDEAIYSLVNLIEEGSDRAVEASLAILYNLSMDSENHSALVAAGAVQVLKRIVLANRTHWERALLLLRTLQP
ncbi:U-box domain-containing protein 12 [Glycine soja]|uniref:U-box domain-containing protein 12 n=1 Tax=Glycine soja TaxID=3848 RepID=A0A0B2P6D4_GLYSO|nr:U-box domain-containing protein 12 [Glycine soja]